MIKLDTDLALPVIYCDTCGKPVTPADMVTWDEDASGKPGPFHFVHLGACDETVDEPLSMHVEDFIVRLARTVFPSRTAAVKAETDSIRFETMFAGGSPEDMPGFARTLGRFTGAGR